METFRRILEAAVKAGASDIHLKAGAPVIYRINGDLQPTAAPAPTDAWMSEVLQHILSPAGVERLATELELDFACEITGLGRFRTNVYQQRGSYAIAMRLVKTEIRSFDQLHLPPVLRHLADAPHGIVLLAGATGTGKSTTMASMIDHINATRREHIVTIEDPIEYLFTDRLSMIEQREIGIDTLGFKIALRHVLRQDPDVIVIGEMRDAESFSAAMSAAITGHLVLSTLHAGDAPQSVQRILEFFPGTERESTRHRLAATLRAIVCQRLINGADGGLVPTVEVLVNNSTVRKLIETDKLDRLSAAIELGEDGMQSFQQSLYRLATDGKISRAEALGQAPNADALRMNFQGIFLNEDRRILGAGV